LLEQPSLKARGSQLIPQVLQKSALPPGWPDWANFHL
jgi:hypothetical protein